MVDRVPEYLQVEAGQALGGGVTPGGLTRPQKAGGDVRVQGF